MAGSYQMKSDSALAAKRQCLFCGKPEPTLWRKEPWKPGGETHNTSTVASLPKNKENRHCGLKGFRWHACFRHSAGPLPLRIPRRKAFCPAWSLRKWMLQKPEQGCTPAPELCWVTASNAFRRNLPHLRWDHAAVRDDQRAAAHFIAPAWPLPDSSLRSRRRRDIFQHRWSWLQPLDFPA